MTLVINSHHVLEVTFTRTDSRLRVDIPWDEADRCLEYFRGRGIDSTLVLDAPARKAHLEVWTEQGDPRLDEVLRQAQA
jgi:hypothetical protein